MGIEYERVESCEMGYRGFVVVGSDWADAVLSRRTSSASGAVLGYILDKDFGNTSVTRARCFVCYRTS